MDLRDTKGWLAEAWPGKETRLTPIWSLSGPGPEPHTDSSLREMASDLAGKILAVVAASGPHPVAASISEFAAGTGANVNSRRQNDGANFSSQFNWPPKADRPAALSVIVRDPIYVRVDLSVVVDAPGGVAAAKDLARQLEATLAPADSHGGHGH